MILRGISQRSEGIQAGNIKGGFSLISCTGSVRMYEKRPTANRRESCKAKPCSAKAVRFASNPLPPFGLPEPDLLFLTLAIQLRCLARPFIGNVRANPVAAPAAPMRGKWVFTMPLFNHYYQFYSMASSKLSEKDKYAQLTEFLDG